MTARTMKRVLEGNAPSPLDRNREEHQEHEVPPAAVEQAIENVTHDALQTVSLTLPVAPLEAVKRVPFHIDGQLWTLARRQTMGRLRVGLELAGAKTDDGKPVNSEIQAIRWLLEDLARRLGNG
ncbi:MAG: hypothetical protein ACLQLG_18650 [Thermoguttaceae bacterium]